MGRLSDFITASKRIFVVSKKPVWPDYKVMIKITGLGIVLIALIGFVMSMIFMLIRAIFNITL
jgi:protein transport protein SEC61 subunit gamma-like protein